MALVLTACSSTANRLDTNPAMPPVPSVLLIRPQRPAPPESGDTEALLTHAAEFGAYVSRLENQLDGWRRWAIGETP